MWARTIVGAVGRAGNRPCLCLVEDDGSEPVNVSSAHVAQPRPPLCPVRMWPSHTHTPSLTLERPPPLPGRSR